jgi:hypothetical protein
MPHDTMLEAIHALNEQYIEGIRNADAEWFDAHMHDDVLVILSTGRRLDKAGFLAMLRDEPKLYRSLGLSNVRLREFGTTVQVDADTEWELEDGRAGCSRYIDTYAMLDGRWQVISAQITALPAAKP